jgi:hypothetical protein
MFTHHTRKVSFKEGVDGLWGQFDSASGPVDFIMARARLGAPGDNDPAVALTAQLAPVREALDTRSLDFNQLLQRDLDDHRVATELIPYLMEGAATGPAYFPPILVAALPFRGQEVIEEFPKRESFEQQRVEDFGETLFAEERWGEAFRVQRMLDQEGKAPSPLRFARVGWNPAQCKLVVLDGQHRAMALLAVQRTLTNSWRGSTGEKYRYFYEHQVERLLAKLGGREKAAERLARIEFPVNLMWFPTARPHVAARKLFVDVNKNARMPSEARLVLLSDTELVNIFTRSLLNRLRSADAPIPLRAVEYDQPSVKSDRPARWSVFTNLLILRDMVHRTVWGPEKNITDVELTFIGRPSEDKMDIAMRDRLGLRHVLPEEIDEGVGNRPIKFAELTNRRFPVENRDARAKLEQAFLRGWGEALLILLGGFLPWRRHCEALEEEYANWTTDDAVSSLAKDALFEGVGMFWTLRDTADFWEKGRSEGRITDKEPPEIVKLWRSIDRDNKHGRARNFIVKRAHHLLGKVDEESVRRAEALFASVNTFACQIGAALTVATLQDRHPSLSPPAVAEITVRAWNATLETGPTNTRKRMCVLAKGEDKAFNMLPKMDGADAVYFRAMLLELLLTPEAREVWAGTFDRATIVDLTETARGFYLDRLVKERANAIKRAEPNLSEVRRVQKARDGVQKELGDSLKHWFGLRADEYREWLERANLRLKRAPQENSTDDADEATLPEPSASSEPDPDELIDE